ncbi:MAG TPA: cysteine--tRNA ligase [Rhizomicrobium sp.]|nr:cysteine--tRNA ligase [Rhizomicrobium sp.]
MTLRLFNTLTKIKEDFVPLNREKVRMYVCGPTVYDFAHIGNARPAIVFDILYRLLKHLAASGEWDEGKGETQVTYVRNITDVDDKINERALRDFPRLPLNEAIRRITEKTEKQYHDDVDALGCLRPDFEPRATEFVLPRPDGKTDMLTLIAQLIARGHAYEAGGEVLFDIQSMPDYGLLSGRRLDEQQAGARVAVDAHKKHPHDFVLWKLSADNEPGWESPWGRGRPGWHIECSAMAAAYLGTMFDIHGGGLDLTFPHHENEIAQSRCAHGTPLMASVWMHNGFLQVEGEKMSKSLGNFFTIDALLRKAEFGGRSWPGEVLRMAMLKTHYRRPIDWTVDSLAESAVELRNWANALSGSFLVGEILAKRKRGLKPAQAVYDALSDDLNTPEAITAMRQQFSKVTMGDASAAVELMETCEFLGLLRVEKLSAYNQYYSYTGSKLLPPHLKSGMEEIQTAVLNDDTNRIKTLCQNFADEGVVVTVGKTGVLSYEVTDAANGIDDLEIRRLVEMRNAARKNKDFKESDRIRDDLLAKGIVLKDGPEGTVWEIKK